MSTPTNQTSAREGARTNHVLKPHHLLLCKILQITFEYFNEKCLPQAFMLNLYRVVMLEIAEVRAPHHICVQLLINLKVRQPATYAQIISAIEEGAKATTDLSRSVINKYKTWVCCSMQAMTS